MIRVIACVLVAFTFAPAPGRAQVISHPYMIDGAPPPATPVYGEGTWGDVLAWIAANPHAGWQTACLHNPHIHAEYPYDPNQGLHVGRVWSATYAGSCPYANPPFTASFLFYICPPDSGWYPPTRSCLTYVDVFRTNKPPSCGRGGSGESRGNPIFPLLGVKRETVDTGLNVGGHTLKLTYDSSRRAPGVPLSGAGSFNDPPGFGPLWLSSLHRRLVHSYSGHSLVAYRGDGTVRTFRISGNSITSDPDNNDRLIRTSGGYRYVDETARAHEAYDSSGKLQTIAYASGESLTLVYSDSGTPLSQAPAPGYLIRVQDSSGRGIDLHYELPAGGNPNKDGRVARLVNAAGASTIVGYAGNGMLGQLTWPGGEVRQFLYERSDLAWALTGVFDERLRRYSTFGYDTAGRANATHHGSGSDAYSVTYGSPPQVVIREELDANAGIIYRYHEWQMPVTPSVTEPNSSVTGLTPTAVLGYPRVGGHTQPAGSGCAASSSALSYDANGNVASADDFNTHRTCYANDLGRNLETVRVEGLAASAACTVTNPGTQLPVGSRKFSSQWHPDWPLRTRYAEPSRVTTYVYNGQQDPFTGAVVTCAPNNALLPQGRPSVLCRQVEQATDDIDGSQGLLPALQAGVANRVRSWTYDNHGRVLTEVDPLGNVNTFTYYQTTNFVGTDPNAVGYTVGDLQSVTRFVNQLTSLVTTYTQYDKFGNWLQMVDPNGVTTARVFDARQRLRSVTTAGQTTDYVYWPNGPLKRVTQPDASWVEYDYDSANRLFSVSDSMGNSVSFTLDNFGNRREERVNDVHGTLRRALDRGIDALGRVQQVTGRE